MDSVWPALSPGLWIVMHLSGVLAAWLSRLPLSGRAAAFVRGGFGGSFLGVGALALCNPQAEALAWIGSAATLGVMTIAAVWETAQHEPREDLTLSKLLAARHASGAVAD